MSQKFSNERPRSASIKPTRNNITMPQEYIKEQSYPKAPISSSIKIEDKLMNNQIATKKRLEALKKNLEQEELREMQNKPKISEKSRILAEKAEKKFFQQYIETKEPGTHPNSEKTIIPLQETLAKPDIPSKIPVDQVPFSVTKEKAKKPTKSLLNLTVLERNQAWLLEKQEKIGKNRRKKEENALAECTFSPIIQSKNDRSLRDNNLSSNVSYISTPHSIEACTDSSEYHRRGHRPMSNNYRQIAPYQVNVSFKCGIDINNFLKRAK